MPLTNSQRQFYKAFSEHGSGDALVRISPKDVGLLIHKAYLDLNEHSTEALPDWFINEYFELARQDLYVIMPEMVNNLPEVSVEDIFRLFESSGVTDVSSTIYLYLLNLTSLWRRRFKFHNILMRQPFPLFDQIGPRSLLEYGMCNMPLLTSWLIWRKFIYDIDNRSAQETGYLFEPILVSCLGGTSISHRESPVRRLDANNNPTSEGRQIDCYLEDSREVYELKLRVTIAASGQGRFSEELSFPREARAAGLTPVLVVLDPTPSNLLYQLAEAYRQSGGRCLVGEDAWQALYDRAGRGLDIFIHKYIKTPLLHVANCWTNLPTNIAIECTDGQLVIKDCDGNEYLIPRM